VLLSVIDVMTGPNRGAQADDPGLVIEPQAPTWPGLIRQFFTANRNPSSIQTRHELGLPIDRPIIMTGHQATIWHPGILAKYYATDAAAKLTSSASVWLVVDQDSEDPWQVRYPARSVENTDHQALSVAAMKFSPRTSAPDTPAASLLTLAPLSSDEFPHAASPSVRDGLARIHAALTAHRNEPSAGRQLAAALADLLSPLKPATTLFATSSARTALFQRLVDSMRDDPERCVRAYNAAVALYPEAKLRPLLIDDVNVRYELPLWRLEFGHERQRVFAEDLDQISREQLAPRALLMTGFMRAAACDLFVHGKGGGVYESVTDAWFRHWQPRLTLAPVAVVSATLRLSLLNVPAPVADDLRQARWRAHNAPHDPAMLGDEEAGRAKLELVRRINEAKLSGGDSRSLYVTMHAGLERVRVERRENLEQIVSSADSIAARLLDAAIASDRTWPFPLYPSAMLDELARAINAAYAV